MRLPRAMRRSWRGGGLVLGRWRWKERWEEGREEGRGKKEGRGKSEKGKGVVPYEASLGW